MKLRFVVPALFALASAAVSLHAEPVPVPADFALRLELAHEEADQTGLVAAIEAWRTMLLASDPSQSCDCASRPEEVARIRKAWGEAVAKEFDAKRIGGQIEAAVAVAQTPAQLQERIAFNKSPLGRRLIAAELAVATRAPEKQDSQAALTEIARLDKARAVLKRDPARARIIDGLIAEAGGVEAEVSAFMSISKGMILGSFAAAPASRPRPDEETVRQMLEAQRAMLSKMLTVIAAPARHNMFEKLSNADLAAVLAWRRKTGGVQLQSRVNAAFEAAMSETSARIATAFAKSMTGSDI